MLQISGKRGRSAGLVAQHLCMYAERYPGQREFGFNAGLHPVSSFGKMSRGIMCSKGLHPMRISYMTIAKL